MSAKDRPCDYCEQPIKPEDVGYITTKIHGELRVHQKCAVEISAHRDRLKL